MNNKFENEKAWRKKNPRASLIRIEHFTRLNTGLNLFLSIRVSVFEQPIYIYIVFLLNKAEEIFLRFFCKKKKKKKTVESAHQTRIRLEL